MSYEQGCERYGAVKAVKSCGWSHVILVRSVQALDELFECSPLFGFGIKVLETDDFVVLDIGIVFVQGIQEVNAGRIRRIAVGHKVDFLVGGCGPDSFHHGNYGGLSVTVVCDVIGGDFEALG